MRGWVNTLAAVELDEPGQDPQQGRLAGAVAADEADPVALGQHRVEAVEQLLLADPQSGVVQGEEGWGHVRAIGDAWACEAAGHARPRRAYTTGRPSMQQDDDRDLRAARRPRCRDYRRCRQGGRARSRGSTGGGGTSAGRLRRYSEDGTAPGPADAFYPFVGIAVEASALSLDGRLAYGALHDPRASMAPR